MLAIFIWIVILTPIAVAVAIGLMLLREARELRTPWRRYVRYSVRAFLSLTAAVSVGLVISPRELGMICIPFLWCAIHFGPEFVGIAIGDARGSHRSCRSHLLREKRNVKRRKWWLRHWKTKYIASRHGRDHQVGIDYREPRE